MIWLIVSGHFAGAVVATAVTAYWLAAELGHDEPEVDEWLMAALVGALWPIFLPFAGVAWAAKALVTWLRVQQERTRGGAS